MLGATHMGNLAGKWLQLQCSPCYNASGLAIVPLLGYAE